MKKVALVVFNGEFMCFVHVLLNALDMKERGYDVKIVIEGAATKVGTGTFRGRQSFERLLSESEGPRPDRRRVQSLFNQDGSSCRSESRRAATCR